MAKLTLKQVNEQYASQGYEVKQYLSGGAYYLFYQGKQVTRGDKKLLAVVESIENQVGQ